LLVIAVERCSRSAASINLPAEAAPKGRDLVVDEFKKVLTLYLGTIVYQEEARAK